MPHPGLYGAGIRDCKIRDLTHERRSLKLAWNSGRSWLPENWRSKDMKKIYP